MWGHITVDSRVSHIKSNINREGETHKHKEKEIVISKALWNKHIVAISADTRRIQRFKNAGTLHDIKVVAFFKNAVLHFDLSRKIQNGTNIFNW